MAGTVTGVRISTLCIASISAARARVFEARHTLAGIIATIFGAFITGAVTTGLSGSYRPGVFVFADIALLAFVGKIARTVNVASVINNTAVIRANRRTLLSLAIAKGFWPAIGNVYATVCIFRAAIICTFAIVITINCGSGSDTPVSHAFVGRLAEYVIVAGRPVGRRPSTWVNLGRASFTRVFRIK
jgi:hypothetical protein